MRVRAYNFSHRKRCLRSDISASLHSQTERQSVSRLQTATMASQTHHMGAGSGKSQAADGKNSMSIIDIRSVLVATVHTATKFDLVDVVDDFSCDTDLQKVGEQEKACSASDHSV